MHFRKAASPDAALGHDSIDWSSAIPWIAGLVIVAGIFMGGSWMIRSTDNERLKSPKTKNGIVSEFKDVYPTLNADKVVDEADKAAAQPSDVPVVPIGGPGPRASYASFTPPVQRGGPNDELYLVQVGDSEPQETYVSVNPTELEYLHEIGSFVGRVSITNRTAASIIGFELYLEIDSKTYKLNPFSGKPIAPKAMSERLVKPGQLFDCPVIAKTKKPSRHAAKIVKAVFYLDGNPGRVEVETEAD